LLLSGSVKARAEFTGPSHISAHHFFCLAKLFPLNVTVFGGDDVTQCLLIPTYTQASKLQ